LPYKLGSMGNKMRRLSLVALIVSVILAASGQVLLKLGASGRTQILNFINFFVLLGLTCYLVSVFLWIQILSRAPYISSTRSQHLRLCW
jgi:hypothetical protein